MVIKMLKTWDALILEICFIELLDVNLQFIWGAQADLYWEDCDFLGWTTILHMHIFDTNLNQNFTNLRTQTNLEDNLYFISFQNMII